MLVSLEKLSQESGKNPAGTRETPRSGSRVELLMDYSNTNPTNEAPDPNDLNEFYPTIAYHYYY